MREGVSRLEHCFEKIALSFFFHPVTKQPKVMGLPEDLFREDTALAFVVALVLSITIFGLIYESIGFAVLFVLVFLTLKHMFIG